MAGIPKVKITFDADFDELKKGIKGGQAEIETFGSKVGDFGKKAGLAFAAAGVAAAAYAGKLLIDGVKSAIADEAAQAKLATTLQNVTGATDAQVAATEKYILKTSLANGITDDQLRPSLERLLRATKDVAESQRLQTLALDIAAGSGKSLEAVSNALGKAYEGNSGALAKLGVGLSAAQLKTMSMDDVTQALATTFGGQAAQKADTFAGKMDRLNVAFDEGKETVGSFVLDAITPMVNTFVKDVVPVIQKFAEEIGPKLQPVIKFLGDYIQEVLLPAFKGIWGFINDFLIPIFSAILTPAINGLRGAFEKVQKAISDNSEELQPFFNVMKAVGEFARDTLAPIFGTTLKLAFNVLGTIISSTISGFSKIVDAVTRVVNAVKAFIKLMTDNPITRFFGLSGDNSKGLKAGGAEFNPNVGGDMGGGTTMPAFNFDTGGGLFEALGLGGAGVSKSFTLRQLKNMGITQEIANKLAAEDVIRNAAMQAQIDARSRPNINVTVNGAIDAEGTARTIVDTLNNSFFRGTGGASNLQTT